MHRPQPDDCSSSNEDEQTDIESCFDRDEDSDTETNPTDVDTDEDEDYPLKYYLKQQDDFDESEFTSEN
jgi:hypothetical protein